MQPNTSVLSTGAPLIRHCDVCLLLDGDRRSKEVTYCKLCDKFMCAACNRNPLRRAAAATAYKVGQFFGRFKRGTQTV
jgi:hypothetical protein